MALSRGALVGVPLAFFSGEVTAALFGLVVASLCFLERAVAGRNVSLRDHASGAVLLWPLVVALLMVASAQRPYVDALLGGASFPEAAAAALGWIAAEWRKPLGFDAGGGVLAPCSRPYRWSRRSL